MRYLYGDSSPFPLQYNFLSTLETFVACAARAVQLHRDFDQVHAGTSAAAVARGKALSELETFHRAVMRAVHDSASRSTEPATVDYARQIEEHAARIVEDARRVASAATEREQAQMRAEAEKRRGEIRTSMESFLIVGRLPTADWKISMRLAGHRNELSAIFTNADGIVTQFTLAASQVPAWQGPRKVSEFAHGVDLQVGIKKSWLKRTPQPEVVHLDDFYVGGFDLSDDAAEIRLRRRPEAADNLVFYLRREDTELLAEVRRPGEEEPEGMVSHVDPGDRAQLERLWQLLRTGVSEALTRKERLLSVTLDGKDIFEHDLVVPFIQRLLKQLGPTVAEIARRSPNPQELSLKHEDDAGRREEIYVKKQDLVSKLEPLDRESRAVFASLGLTPEDALAGEDVSMED